MKFKGYDSLRISQCKDSGWNHGYVFQLSDPHPSPHVLVTGAVRLRRASGDHMASGKTNLTITQALHF